MLNTPARNAMATASPVMMSGVARTRVPDPIAYHDPNDPRIRASVAEATSRPAARSNPPTHNVIPAMRPTAIQREERRRVVTLVSPERELAAKRGESPDRGDAQCRSDRENG